MHASSGRAEPPALLVAGSASLVDVATSADVVAAASGVLGAALVGIGAFCAVEPDDDEHPAKPRISAAVIA